MSNLSPTVEDYLKYIWSATEWSDMPVTTSRLAGDLGLSPSTVSEMVARLAKDGLVEHRKYRAIRLTEEGKAHALMTVRAHRLIETFLHDKLGYSWDEVHDEADALEHSVSTRFIDAIDDLLGNPAFDPHGDPIPARDGSMVAHDAFLLSKAPSGRYRVLRVDDSDPEALRQSSKLGLHPGTAITVTDGSVTVHESTVGPDSVADIIWVVADPYHDQDHRAV
ncbi:metal-dependent transcriptional regulator [Flaviflexus massiliensis]|uniref:metal-dependent transcriptional regulator n=1 Tax=Flaviflexus massiliensis TaxID=1522309 RepID=UPI000AE521E3|nr:metal-dependent transcriptional regulator [Flaviflexus massiliensis]